MMKLFLKILLFIFTILITTVGEARSSTVVTILQEETSSSFLQKSQLATVSFETHFENSCLNGENVITCSEWVVSIIANAAKTGTTVLEGAVKSNYGRFVSKMPANAKSSASFQLLEDGNYLFQATSPGKVPGSSALYQKWVNPQGETFNMIKTTFAPDGSIIHIKPKF